MIEQAWVGLMVFAGVVLATAGWIIVNAVRVHRIRRGNLKRYRPSPWN